MGVHVRGQIMPVVISGQGGSIFTLPSINFTVRLVFNAIGPVKCILSFCFKGSSLRP